MAQTLRLKRSSVPGRVPTTATLQTGEIAINTADGLVYIRKDDDTIIPLIGANTTVTGSVVILGSIEATSFSGSFSGSFEGPLNGTLSRTIGSGDGIVSFLFDGSENVTVTLDTGSDHFRSAVINLIDTNAPSIIAQDTTGPSGIDLSYNSETGALSGSLVNSEIVIGDNAIALGQTVSSISSVEITGSFKGDASGSFIGDFTGDGSGLTGLLADAVRYPLNIGAGLAGGEFDGSTPVTASIEVTSTHFRDGVHSHITASNTEGPGGIDLSFDRNAGLLSASLVSSSITIGQTEIDLGATAEAINGLQLTNVIATGSFSGSFDGELLTTASWAYNAVSSSYALASTSASFATSASYALTSTSASYTAFATSASYAATTDNAVSASYAATATSASHALIADYALNANVNTGSLLETGSISNATITLTKVNGTSFDLTVNNVATASLALLANTASYSERAVSSSYAAFATSASYALYTAFAEDAISASYAATASSANDFLIRGDATVNGDLTVDGIVTAREFHTQFISASITYDSGSNKFGDSADDIHQFTGSVIVSGSIDSDDITIDAWGSVSASLALLNASSSAVTLQQATDNGNTTTNEVIINNQLQVSSSIYSKGEEVLDFAVAMAIALG